MAIRCTRNPRLVAALSFVAVSALAGCGDDAPTVNADAGADTADAGAGDSGMTDTGMTDGGMTDSGMTDSGVTDTGMTDTGMTDASDDATTAPLAVIGEYDTDLGTFVRVTESGIAFTWYGAERVAISYYDNDAMFLVGQNSDDDTWNPGLWSRFDWAPVGDDAFAFCWSFNDGATEDDATNAERPDFSDTETGCAGSRFWTLTPGQGPIAIEGLWFDGFTTHAIEDATWTQFFGSESSSATYSIVSFDNASGVAIAQNDESNDVAGGLWSRFDFAYIDGQRWYCTTTYDSATREDAETAEPADASDPANGGCSTFPWSPLDPVE